MKIIKPNNIKTENSNDLLKYKITSSEAVKNLVRINDEHIQYVKAELDNNLLNCEMHPFVQAVHWAYAKHLPLVISPDMIWYLISSAVAVHINKNSEELRYKFVNHEGKKTINIRRDDFILNSKSNPWHEVIDDFSSEIRKLTKNDVADTLVANFSTTTKDSRVISQIVLMDAMQKYFDYKFTTRCGIPEIRIKGTKQDWENVKSKTNQVLNLIPDLSKWYNNGLSEVLDNFINAFDDKGDNSFWNEIYKIGGGSGGPYISGWILALFPYLSKEKENSYVWSSSWKESCSGYYYAGVTTISFEYHMNQVPFIWDYLGLEIPMLFIGGLLGVNVDKDHSLTPVFGYAVTENKINNRQN